VYQAAERGIDIVSLRHVVIRPIHNRRLIGELLESEGFKSGVELGVLKGEFSEQVLHGWPSCEKYVLVDAWRPLENYVDSSNFPVEIQEDNFMKTMKRMEKWKSKIEVCRNLTTNCAKKYNKEKFDFVYVDARHDSKGVTQDLEDWWPLVKEGGVMAGHDFVTQSQGGSKRNNWTLNMDGTVDETGLIVYGAVVNFFSDPKHTRQIFVTYRDPPWNTWMVRK
jgi:hypothetical protein